MLCSKINKLNNLLDELQKPLNDPELFVYNHINNLENDVDIAYETKQFNNAENSDEINSKRNQIIDEITQFKKNNSRIQFSDQIKEDHLLKIAVIKTKLKNVNDIESLNDIEDEINREFIKIQSYLFNNRTIIFLNESNYEDKRFFRNTDFKLVIIADEFICQEGVELLKKKNLYQLDPKLTEEKIIIEKFKEKFINLPVETNEIKLNFNSLKELSITNNTFFTIDQQAFDRLTNLQELALSENKLKTIHPNSFTKLSKLQQLSLSYNALEHIDKATFNQLTNLTRLSLRQNKLINIEPTTFSALVNLEVLDLYENKIKSIDSNTFFGLKKLKEINLKSNDLRFIEPDIFNGLDNLKLVDLSLNRLTDVDKTKFSDGFKLKL